MIDTMKEKLITAEQAAVVAGNSGRGGTRPNKATVYRWMLGGYPKWFAPSAVSAWLAWTPAKRTQEKLRAAGTVGQYRAQGRYILRWLRVPVEIERRKRRKFPRLPPVVPKLDAIAPAGKPRSTARPCRLPTAARSS